MSSITTSAFDTPARRSVERTCDDLAMLALAVVTIVAGLTFRDYGLGWDDYTHAEYADLLLRMYGSGFRDTGALSFANLYMYGGGFDMAAALAAKVLPFDFRLPEPVRVTVLELVKEPPLASNEPESVTAFVPIVKVPRTSIDPAATVPLGTNVAPELI